MKKQGKLRGQGLLRILFVFSLFLFVTPYTTEAYFTSKANVDAGLKLELGRIELNTINKEPTSRTPIDGRVENTGSLDAKLAYEIQVKRQSDGKKLSEDELNEYFPKESLTVLWNGKKIPLELSDLNPEKHQFFTDGDTPVTLESGQSAEVKLIVGENAAVQENVTVAFSCLLIQSNAEKVTDPLFYDMDSIEGVIERNEEKEDWPSREHFIDGPSGIQYALMPQYIYHVVDENGAFQPLNSAFIYFSFLEKYQSEKIEYKRTDGSSCLTLQNREDFEEFNGFRLEINSQKNIGYNNVMFELDFTYPPNSPGNTYVEHMNFSDSQLKEPSVFTRELILSTDELDNSGSLQEKAIQTSADARSIQFHYLPKGREEYNSRTYPADDFNPKKLDITIYGKDADFFGYEIISEEGKFSSIDIWQKSAQHEKKATMKITITGTNGNKATITRPLISQSSQNKPSSRSRKTMAISSERETVSDETGQLPETNVIQPSDALEDTSAPEKELFSGVSEPIDEAIEGESVIEEEPIPSTEDDENNIVFHSVSQLNDQVIGLPQSFWVLLQSEEINPSALTDLSLDLSQTTEEDMLAPTLQWLLEETGTGVEIERHLRKDYFVLSFSQLE